MSFNLNTSVNSNTAEWKKAVKPVENVNQIPKDNVIDEEKNKNIPSTTKKEDIKQSTLVSVNEMKNDVKEAFESAESQAEEKISERSSQVFEDINISNIEVLDEKKIDIEMNPKKISDENTLKDTVDDAKLGRMLDNGKVIRDILEPDVKKLVKDLDGALLKDAVYKKAEKLGKSFMENLDVKDPIVTKLSISTLEEKREILVNTVFDVKSKYAEKFNKANDKYESNNLKIENLSKLSKIVDSRDSLPEEKITAKALFMDSLKKDFPECHKKFINKKFLPDSKDIQEYNKKPTMFDVLPENKQKLINSMIKGISSGDKNLVVGSQKISLDDDSKILDNTLKPKEAERLEKYLKEAASAKGITNPSIVIPEKINFQGKEYTYDALLGGGGDGIAFSMKSDDGEKIVLKSQIRSDVYEGAFGRTEEEKIEETNNSFREELNPHIHISQEGKNDKILDLKGVVKNGTEIFSITEFAKGGEMNDVTDSINNSNLIDDKIKKLVKTSMLKDALEGLQHMHTELNMVHHDVKPKNFFVSEDGKTKVADFGKSKIGHNILQGQSSPAYESIINSSDKADIFAMGISIAETLKNKDVAEIREELLEIKKYSGKDPEDNVINGMISDEPNDRPTFTAVLKHSLFNNEILNNPQIKDNLDALVGAFVNKDDVKITELNDQIKELLKT